MTSKLMTEQHTIDDALADSALAALVADDVYYFETYESAGTPVIRFRNHDEAYAIGYDIPDRYYQRFMTGELDKKDTFANRELTTEPKFVQKRKAAKVSSPDCPENVEE